MKRYAERDGRAAAEPTFQVATVVGGAIGFLVTSGLLVSMLWQDVEAGAGVVGGLSMAMVTGGGYGGGWLPIRFCVDLPLAVFPTVATDTAATEDTAATDTVRRS
jgi:hypothetical protein